MNMKALDDITVLDISENISGPYCAKLLAAFGAEVIKVERPGIGDRARYGDGISGDGNHLEKSPLFLYLNTGKKGVVLDLYTQKGRDIFRNLSKRADVVVENHMPGTLAKLGIGYEDLRKDNPGLVMVSITDFGQTGPYRYYRGGRLVGYAMGGYTYLNGESRREPLAGAGEQPAYQGGVAGYIGALSALFKREHSGEGDHVDVSIMECMAHLHQYTLSAYEFSGKIQKRLGNRHLLTHPVTIYPCRDGYFVISAVTDDQAERLLTLMGMQALIQDHRFKTGRCRLIHADEFDALVSSWFKVRTRIEIARLCGEWRVPGAAVNSMADMINDPHFAHRRFFKYIDHPVAGLLPYADAPFKMSKTPALTDRAPFLGEHNDKILMNDPGQDPKPVSQGKRGDPTAGPLSGSRILELTHVWAGPLAGRVLADLGAEVIRIVSRNMVESEPVSSDEAAFLGIYPDNDPQDAPWERHALGNDVNRNKLGMTLELNIPDGLTVFKALVKKSHVVLNNFSPRVMENFGLDYGNLKKINRGIISCSISGYGLSGPFKDHAAFGAVIEGASGLSSLMGYPGDGPMLSGNPYPDPAAAMHGVAAVLTALHHWHKTGQGQEIDLSQCDSAACLLGEKILQYAMTGELPEKEGNSNLGKAFWGCYPCKGDDQWVVIEIASDEEKQALVDAMENPAWSKEWPAGRELYELLSQWTLEKTHYEVMHLLQKMGLSAGAVLNAKELFHDPHLNERGFFTPVHKPGIGVKSYAGLPFRFKKASNFPNKPSPLLGEHNHFVLKTILGMTESEVAALERHGVIGRKPLEG
jgi:crotonobetainyl-CoA:carnitine CoA-transferase CaiB-like acyl-CoA transferase